jgi:hypothetical protein
MRLQDQTTCPFILDLYKDLEDPALVKDRLVNVLLTERGTIACLMSWTLCVSTLLEIRTNYTDISQLPTSPSSNRHAAASPTDSCCCRTRQSSPRAHLARIPYLKGILNESKGFLPFLITRNLYLYTVLGVPTISLNTALRFYPQPPANMRIANKTTLLPSGGGPSGTSPVLIPKGTAVGYSIYHMHRMANLYGENAHEFRPERWENTHLEKKVGWCSPPFMAVRGFVLGVSFFEVL